MLYIKVNAKERSQGWKASFRSILWACGLLAGLCSAQAQDTTGLWVGNVFLNQVNQPATGTNDTMGAEALMPTASELVFRLIVHVDSNGQSRLLQRVLITEADGASTNDPARGVLLADESLVNSMASEGAEVRRISTVAFHLMDPVAMVGQLDGTNTLTCTVVVDYDDPTNPFKHTFHPDHDNLDDSYTQMQPPSKESFTLTRAIQLAFNNSDPDGDNPLFGTDVLAGDYVEEITGLHQASLFVGGSFRLERVIEIGVLEE